MTAVTDFMLDAKADATTTPVASPAHALDGGRLMVRGGQSVLGTALILAAVGLWVIPGSDVSGDVMLMKLVLSLTAGIIGVALTQQGKAPATPEVEIDTVRREIRLVRRAGKREECVHACKFADLDRAEVRGAHVILWGKGDVMLAEVGLSDPQLRRSLMSSLVDAGKL